MVWTQFEHYELKYYVIVMHALFSRGQIYAS